MRLAKWMRLRADPEPFEPIIKENEQNGPSRQVLDLLKVGHCIARPELKTDVYLNRVRRYGQVKPAEIFTLLELARRLGKASKEYEYHLLLAVYAAAVASCGYKARFNAAIALAEVALATSRCGEASRACFDAWESRAIYSHLAYTDRAWNSWAHSKIEKTWSRLRGKNRWEAVYYYASVRDLAGVWLKHVEWNTDRGQASDGLVAQADAAERLAISIAHWRFRLGGKYAYPVRRYIGRCLKLKDRFLATRYLVILGNALMRVGDCELASTVHSSVSTASLVDADHPLRVHAILKHAFCQFKLGNRSGCQALMCSVNLGRLKDQAVLADTSNNEYLRYLVLRDMIVRDPRYPSEELRNRVQYRFYGRSCSLAAVPNDRQRDLLRFYDRAFDDDMYMMLREKLGGNKFYVDFHKGPKGILLLL